VQWASADRGASFGSTSRPWPEIRLPRAAIFELPNETLGTQGNRRISVGIVYHIGEKQLEF
jgi:hypothetical protein